ncbi:probable long-chain-alcohol O-fatty-acyltransferase 5 [Lolium rigidum]|uniref:probable long-chain-alcohol O-fatty-acyltransferase 5 n=1 Tax=Lolium rigidum TaxID=89674 RepID=UPI001F5C64DB|nr:probable long-chain-alcohol O-fatty-acyltransferase 5 [Lolium rigidum]
MAGGDLRSLALVSAVVTVAMCYVRLAARRLRPGLPRLAAFFPVLAILPFLPLAFRAVQLRVISGFFLAWLAEFKLLLLANGQGPLHPSLPLPTFVAVASGPIRLRTDKPAQTSPWGLGLVSSAVMAALLAVVVSLYRYKERMHQYLLLSLYASHIYLTLELVLAFMAAAARTVLGLDLEPQFDRPYLSSSLRDYWGRRWNLSVPAVLRPCVYRPVRAWLGSAPAGVLAAFLVSGLMHELMICYITLRPPTGEATVLFVLYGACAVAETWWARHDNWWRPPRLAATPLALAFVSTTAFWLFFPPIMRHGADKVIIAECEAAVAFLRDVGAGAAGSVRSVWTGSS